MARLLLCQVPEFLFRSCVIQEKFLRFQIIYICTVNLRFEISTSVPSIIMSVVPVVSTTPGRGLTKIADRPLPLLSLNKEQLVRVGNAAFDLDLVLSPTVLKETLRDDIKAAMAGTAGCGCAGQSESTEMGDPPENLPCTPQSHLFPPDIINPPASQFGAAVNGLLAVAQQDGPVTSTTAQFIDPSLPPLSLNTAADSSQQRRAVLEAAASRQAQADAESARQRQESHRLQFQHDYGFTVPHPGVTLVSPVLAPVSIAPLVSVGPPLVAFSATTSASPFAGGSIMSVGGASSAGGLLAPGHFTPPVYGVPAAQPPPVLSAQQQQWLPAGQPQHGFTGLVEQPSPTPSSYGAPVPQPAQPAQPQAADLTAAIAGMMQQMSLDRAEERRLREQELANQRSMYAIIAGRSIDPSASGSSAASNAVLDVLNPSRGRLGIVARRNPVADREAGVSLPPQFGIVGDMATIDMTSARHKIRSGKDASDHDEVIVQELWPNQFLERMLCGKVKHQDLDPVKFACGFVTKVYCEMPKESAGAREHNMLRVLMLLLKLALNTPWTDVIMLNDALFSALERKSITWDSWPDLNRWWDQALLTLNVKQAGRRLASQPPVNPAGPKRGAEVQPPGLPPAKVQKRAVMGVPGEWLREQLICIKFNLGRCTLAAPHQSPVGSSVMLRHLCGGCLFLEKGSDGGHGMSACPNKNSTGFFA